MNIKKIIFIPILIPLLTGCSKIQTVSEKQANVQSIESSKTASLQNKQQKEIRKIHKEQVNLQKDMDNQLGSINFQNGQIPYITINKNKSSLKMKNWTENCIIYQDLDGQKRCSQVTTAFLEKRNVSDKLIANNNVIPSGWHKNDIYVKGSIIPYNISKGICKDGTYKPQKKPGASSNKKNTFTETKFCQESLQYIYEKKIKKALESGQKVIYQVMPVYYQKDAVPKGIWLQAKGDKGLDFNVYIFNVQPGYSIDYKTGNTKPDKNFKISKFTIK